MIGKVIVGGLAVTLLPIFRGAGHPRTDGVNFWRLVYDSTKGIREETSVFGHKHILYEEAVQRARSAYQEYQASLRE